MNKVLYTNWISKSTTGTKFLKIGDILSRKVEHNRHRSTWKAILSEYPFQRRAISSINSQRDNLRKQQKRTIRSLWTKCNIIVNSWIIWNITINNRCFFQMTTTILLIKQYWAIISLLFFVFFSGFLNWFLCIKHD